EQVLIGHALKNAAVPIVTIIGIGVALLIGGVVVTETVFAIPGLGRLTVDAILRRDYPIIQGIILIFSGAYVLINLLVDLSYTLFSTALGLLIGVVAGFTRWVDAIVMRIMDGLMSIPEVLIAIALMALTRASMENVIFAITVAQVPRVTRLVRGIVLTLREQPYVEAAVASGTGFVLILWRHIVPNTLPPLLVQGTFITASAMITEAILSFIGAGTPP